MTTPAQKANIKVGTKVVLNTDDFNKVPGFSRGDILIMKYDDETTWPLFQNASRTEELWIPLKSIKNIVHEAPQAPSIASLMPDPIVTISAPMSDIQRQIAELQRALDKVGSTIAMLDYGLRVNHRVQRLS